MFRMQKKEVFPHVQRFDQAAARGRKAPHARLRFRRRLCLASKQGLRPANCLGVIDSDYRGECFVALHNDSNEERTVRHGDRVAQLVLLPFLPMEFEEVDTLPETVRGEGGFGSTGR